MSVESKIMDSLKELSLEELNDIEKELRALIASRTCFCEELRKHRSVNMYYCPECKKQYTAIEDKGWEASPCPG